MFYCTRSCGANVLLQCRYVCGGLNFFSWWIFVSSLRLSCRLKRDFNCVLLQRGLADSNPLFSLLPNALKSVFGSDLCGLMVGRGQDLQVISPPQDFLTLTQTHRAARLRVGDSVRFLQDNRAAEVTVLSGHPRLRGETDPACLLRSSGVNSFVPNRETKEFGSWREKNYQHPISSQEGRGSVETVLTPTPPFVRGFREQGDCKILPLSVNLLFQCKFVLKAVVDNA